MNRLYNMPELIVKPDNIRFEGNLSKPQVIYATSGSELVSKIMERYGITFLTTKSHRMEIWSRPLGYSRIRLDTMDTIPLDCDQAWIRFIQNSSILHVNSEDVV
jgi:hypothetical protein